MNGVGPNEGSGGRGNKFKTTILVLRRRSDGEDTCLVQAVRKP